MARLPGEKPFRCEICGMQFKYLKSFKKHRLNHAVERLHVYPRALPSPASAGGPMTPGSLAGFMGMAGIMEERSVLEMLARPQHRGDLSGSASSQTSGQTEARVRLHGAGGNATTDGRSSPNRLALIKSEVEVVSSGDEQDNMMDDETPSNPSRPHFRRISCTKPSPPLACLPGTPPSVRSTATPSQQISRRKSS